MPDEVVTAQESAEAPVLTPAPTIPGGLTMWNDTKLMNLAYRTAGMLSRSGLVPDSYRNSPENCLIAIDLANRQGLSPMMVMQNLYVVKGKPAWSGSFCAAAVNGCGKFTPLEYVFVGETGTPSEGCFARATRLSNGTQCVSDTITLKMAKDEGWMDKGGSKWKTMPRQMMMYRAASFFARAHCPEVLLGIQTVEEVQDVRGYSDTSDALKRHVDPEDKLTRRFADSGQSREMYIINESGLYSLVLSSKLPGAKKFKRWVTSEVLPSIRKHGAYMTSDTIDKMINSPEFGIKLLTALRDEQDKRKALETELDRSKEWYSIKRVANLNGVSHKKFDWRKLKSESSNMGYEVRKIFDANYGEVNTYHMRVWEKVYPNMEL